MQQIRMRGSREDAADVATVEEDVAEAAGAVAVVLAVGVMETKARAALRIQTITRLLNGINYPLRNETRFERSATRKENKAEPNDRLVNFRLTSLKR